ncbi:MAG: histidine phosphatase family protein [Thermodesulfobacteriota bacterium]|tara:strand:- start:4888 stop:5496 length:609 start_codon:yes stop_codon:yes gene_type:complete
MKIQLIRHCETEWNRLERCQGISDLELNNNGINQSISLKDFYFDKHVDLIFSSDLKRTMQTALEINKNLKSDIIQNEKLREMDQGDFEGLSFSYIRKNFASQLLEWRSNPKKFRIPNGETLGEVQERALAFMENLFIKYKSHKNIIIVSHNLVIASILCHYSNRDLKDFAEFTLDSGSITTLMYSNNKISIEEINYTKHLER